MPLSHAAAAAVVGRRACAVLAVCSAALHGLMLGDAGQPLVAVLLVAMMAVCVYCAWELWTDGAMRAWCLVAIMNLGMVAVHMTGASHQHGAALQLTAPTTPSALMTVVTTIAAIEVAAAMAVLFYRTRGRAERLSPRIVDRASPRAE